MPPSRAPCDEPDGRRDVRVRRRGRPGALAGFAARHPGVEVTTRAEYLTTLHAASNDQAWGVWLVVGLGALFAALALINTAAMAMSERGAELATIRLLGGTAGQTTRMIALELAPTMLVGLVAGAAVAGLAIIGVPDGVRGIPLVVPAASRAACSPGRWSWRSPPARSRHASRCARHPRRRCARRSSACRRSRRPGLDSNQRPAD